MSIEENLAQVQKEKQAAEALRIDAEKHAEEDKKLREQAIEKMNKEKEEIMEVALVQPISDGGTEFLTKEGVDMLLSVKMMDYLKLMIKICVDNPILIQLNQDTAIEIEEAISKLTDENEIFESKKSLAATLGHIQKLKNEISPENVGTVLEQYRTTLTQLKYLSNTL